MINQIEKLINVDFNNRGVNYLYQDMLDSQKTSILMQVIKSIDEINKKGAIILTTGALARGWVSKEIGETDGPIGTVVLIKALKKYKRSNIILVTEPSLVNQTESFFKRLSFETIIMDVNNITKTGIDVIKIVPFPTNLHESVYVSDILIEKFKPEAIISIEKTGKNDKGIFHNMGGFDYSEGYSHVDELFRLADNNNILTLGIGDGGNEIGMSNVKDVVKKKIPYGAVCRCGCGSGIGSAVPTNLLVTASVSNWACYAIVAAIAIYTKDYLYLHTTNDEKIMMRVAIEVGLIDGVSGNIENTVDGLAYSANAAMINLIEEITVRHINNLVKE